MNFVKKLALSLPLFWQQELKRLYFHYQIRHDVFSAGEPEFDILDQLTSPGDWVIDVGANVGQYTNRLSTLVGVEGRVIAIEPVPATFATLASNVSSFRWNNVTLLNMAASDQTKIVEMDIPNYEDGPKNYYMATIVATGGMLKVLTIALDDLQLKHRIGLVKIDAEGHDFVVVQGMLGLLTHCHPVLIIETCCSDLIKTLAGLGYRSEHLEGSPNMLFR